MFPIGWFAEGSADSCKTDFDRNRSRAATLAPVCPTSPSISALSPIAIEADSANEQHYEVPAEFYQRVLGPRLKYSCGYWPSEETGLSESEDLIARHDLPASGT